VHPNQTVKDSTQNALKIQKKIYTRRPLGASILAPTALTRRLRRLNSSPLIKISGSSPG